MAKLEISVTAQGLTRSRAMDIPAAHMTRATKAMKKAFGPITEDDPQNEGQQRQRERTNEEAWDAFFDQCRTFLIQTVKNVETREAQEAVQEPSEIAAE